MKLELSDEQYQALKGADFMPDELSTRLDEALQQGEKHVVELSGDEATAMEELCAWNVKMDVDGNVTSESKVFDDIVTAILSHPEF